MNNSNFFEDIFESIEDFKKLVLLKPLIENDNDLITRLVLVNVILIG